MQKSFQYSTDFDKQFVVDERGKPVSVIIPIEQWERVEALLERIRDVEMPRPSETEDSGAEYEARQELRTLLQFIGQ